MENLETQRLIIRELEIKDAMRLSEYRDKREVAFYQSWWRYPYQKALKRVEYCVKHPFDGSRGNYQLGVVLKENNISRYKLCKLIGFSYGSLSDLISGRSAIPRLDTIVKIAQVLDLNDHEFAELCGYREE